LEVRGGPGARPGSCAGGRGERTASRGRSPAKLQSSARGEAVDLAKVALGLDEGPETALAGQGGAQHHPPPGPWSLVADGDRLPGEDESRGVPALELLEKVGGGEGGQPQARAWH